MQPCGLRAYGSGPVFSLRGPPPALSTVPSRLISLSSQFKSLELFARFAYTTVTEDAFTCKSKKQAAFPKGLEVSVLEFLLLSFSLTHLTSARL